MNEKDDAKPAQATAIPAAKPEASATPAAIVPAPELEEEPAEDEDLGPGPIPIERLHVQPGFALMQLDPYNERRGRAISILHRAPGHAHQGKPSIADGVCIIAGGAIDIDVSCKSMDLGRVALVPTAAIAATISPEPKKA